LSRFKELRLELKLTQEKFRQQFNHEYNRSYTAAAISQFENDKRTPEISALKDFSDFFNVSIDYLLGQSNIKTEISTIALHRQDNLMDDLPPEAIERVEEFIELMRLKYQKKPTTK